jgi:hypothetical protein
MKISHLKFYGGARDKVCRLGLAHLFLELQQIVLDTDIRLLPQKDTNGAAYVRQALDESFERCGEWTKTTSGGIDWIKRIRYNESIVARMGVEVQVFARSDLLIRDIVHLRNSLQDGTIDIGVIVVPDNLMQVYLPDRTPAFETRFVMLKKSSKRQ